MPVLDSAGLLIQKKQARTVPLFERCLRNQFFREVKIEIRFFHSFSPDTNFLYCIRFPSVFQCLTAWCTLCWHRLFSAISFQEVQPCRKVLFLPDPAQRSWRRFSISTSITSVCGKILIFNTRTGHRPSLSAAQQAKTPRWPRMNTMKWCALWSTPLGSEWKRL